MTKKKIPMTDEEILRFHEDLVTFFQDNLQGLFEIKIKKKKKRAIGSDLKRTRVEGYRILITPKRVKGELFLPIGTGTGRELSAPLGTALGTQLQRFLNGYEN